MASENFGPKQTLASSESSNLSYGAFSHRIYYYAIFQEIINLEGQNLFKSYGDFAEWVDFAYWWSFNDGGSAINEATPSSLIGIQFLRQTFCVHWNLFFHTWMFFIAREVFKNFNQMFPFASHPKLAESKHSRHSNLIFHFYSFIPSFRFWEKKQAAVLISSKQSWPGRTISVR